MYKPTTLDSALSIAGDQLTPEQLAEIKEDLQRAQKSPARPSKKRRQRWPRGKIPTEKVN